jgi:hypothetical protein
MTTRRKIVRDDLLEGSNGEAGELRSDTEQRGVVRIPGDLNPETTLLWVMFASIPKSGRPTWEIWFHRSGCWASYPK